MNRALSPGLRSLIDRGPRRPFSLRRRQGEHFERGNSPAFNWVWDSCTVLLVCIGASAYYKQRTACNGEAKSGNRPKRRENRKRQGWEQNLNELESVGRDELGASETVAAVTTRHAVSRVGLRGRGDARPRRGAGGLPHVQRAGRARRLPSARSGRASRVRARSRGRRRRRRRAELVHRVDSPSSEIDARQSAVTSGALAVVSSGGAEQDGKDRDFLVNKDEAAMQGGERESSPSEIRAGV